MSRLKLWRLLAQTGAIVALTIVAVTAFCAGIAAAAWLMNATSG